MGAFSSPDGRQSPKRYGCLHSTCFLVSGSLCASWHIDEILRQRSDKKLRSEWCQRSTTPCEETIPCNHCQQLSPGQELRHNFSKRRVFLGVWFAELVHLVPGSHCINSAICSLGDKITSIQTYGPSWGLGCPSTRDVFRWCSHRKTGARPQCCGGSGGPIVIWRLVADRRALSVDWKINK